MRSTAISMSVCLSVCHRLSRKPRVQTLRNRLYMLTVAGDQSTSDNNAIRYALPVFMDYWASNP